MKNLSFKFVSITLLSFLIISFLLYVFNISTFHAPAFSAVFTLFYSEKKFKNRMFYLSVAFLIYLQFSTPLPLFFLIFVSVQIYLLTVSFFASTAFDFSLTALINSILSVVIISLNKTIYIYVFTGHSQIFHTIFSTALSTAILILLYNIFKPGIDHCFTKDSWL